MNKIITLILAILTILSASIQAQVAGSLDPTFNTTGKVVYDKDKYDLYNDVKVQPDGRIVAVGTSMSPVFSSIIEVTRFMADGSFDPSFGTNGHYNYALNVENGAYKCLIKDDGSILICGYTTDYTLWSMVLIQLKSDGTPDPSFGTNGIALLDPGPGEDIAYALAIQDNGKILVAGYSQNADYKNVPVIVRFSGTGILDTTFGTGGIASVPVTEIDNDFSGISLQSDGKIVAAGHISNGMSWFSLLIARFDADGNPDTNYGSDGVVNMNLGNVDDEFFDIKLTQDDEAVLAGFTVSQGDFFYHLLVMKFDISGEPVVSFGDQGKVIAGNVPYTFGDALEIQTDGRILVAGCTGGLMPDNNDWALWRFNNNGSPDAGFGTNGMITTEFFGNADEALGMALYQDKIIVAGKTRNATDYLDFAVARYQNDVGVSIPEHAGLTDLRVSPNPVKRGGWATLQYSLPVADKITIEVVTITGEPVIKMSVGIQSAGSHTHKIELPADLTQGVYFLKMSGSQTVTGTIKLVVVE